MLALLATPISLTREQKSGRKPYWDNVPTRNIARLIPPLTRVATNRHAQKPEPSLSQNVGEVPRSGRTMQMPLTCPNAEDVTRS